MIGSKLDKCLLLASVGFAIFVLLFPFDASAISEDDSGGLLFLGSTIEGEISEPGEIDVYIFFLDEESLVTLWTSGSTDTWGDLYTEDIEIITSDDESGDAHNFSIAETLQPGVYAIVVSGWDLGVTVGPYTLNSSVEPAPITAVQYLMTASSSNNTSSLHIINSSLEAQAFTGTLYNQEGQLLGSPNQPLHDGLIFARGRVVVNSTQLESIFGVDPWVGPAMLEVSASGSFELMSKLESPSGLVSNTNCVRDSRVLNIEGFESRNKTFVRLINQSDASLSNITGTLYDTQGEIIGEPDVVLVGMLVPKQAVWLNRDEIAGLVGAEWTKEAMLEVSEAQGLKLLNLNFVNNETFFNFTCFEDSDSNFVFLQTTSRSSNDSFTHIVNTSDQPQTYTGTLHNQDGIQLGTEKRLLHEGEVPAKGRVILSSSDLESLFDVDPWAGPALLEVNGVGSFELMTKLTSPSGLTSNSNCVSRDTVHNIEGGDSAARTFVRFINLGSEAINNIRGTLYDQSGEILGEEEVTLVENLAPYEAVWLNRDELAERFGATWSGEASLVANVDLDDELRMLNLNFVNGETFFNFSCYENSNRAPLVSGEIENQSARIGDVSIDLPTLFSDFDAEDTVDVSVLGLPDGLRFNGSTITGTVDELAAGTYTITVVGTDESLAAASTTFELTIVTGEWTQGIFEPSATFDGYCAVPRVGFDASGAPYSDQPGTTVDENNWLRLWSNELYLWYDEIVDHDPIDHTTPAYFELMKTDELTEAGVAKDNFHFSLDTDDWISISDGESFGYGASYVILSSFPPRQLVISSVEPGSPAALAGLTRGAEILSIDGVDLINGNDVDTINAGLFPSEDGEMHNFTVRDLGPSEDRSITLTAGVVSASQVKSVGTISTDTGIVGYMEFSDHVAPAEQLLIDAFAQFGEEQVTDLVLDLRYNSGGLVGIAGEVAYMIAGSENTEGKTFIEYEYNDKHVEFDPFTGNLLAPFDFPNTSIGYSATPGESLPSLNLNRVYILTGQDTCSASELIMNSLKGIDVEVIQVGVSTCGKPFGFVPEDNCGTTYFSIQFRGLNDKGFGDYVEGFSATSSPTLDTEIPGCQVNDDLFHLLGDPDEAQLAAALYYRENEACPDSAARLHPSARIVPQSFPGLSPWESYLIRDPVFEETQNRTVR